MNIEIEKVTQEELRKANDPNYNSKKKKRKMTMNQIFILKGKEKK
jgi:hypothetical protein